MLPELDARKQGILRAIVRHYVETVEPVGSHTLADRYDLGVKPATLRNEMAEMADMGYLHQPHTSAGRVPSDRGYRFYVNWLITPQVLSGAQRQRLREELERSRAEVERVLVQTCRILTALTHYASMATPPEMGQDVLRQVHLAVLDRHRLLVVIALETGRVEHAVVPVSGDLMTVDLERVERLVADAMRGKTVVQATTLVVEPEEPLSGEGVSVYRAVMEAVREAMRRMRREEDSGDVVVDGTAEVIQQPEFASRDAVRALIDFLEERRHLFSLLREVYTEEARVIIGSESPDPRMQMCSLVAARYTVRGRYVGTIGVLGPTRMDYDRTVPVVREVARSLGEVLTQLSL
ncbi:MAG: heat-inducible transcriptional repressor HrcA [Armatimonadota bacterium]|nr:heat-inducible transcriptional repressor HrcA [Armatimonadota bacterium]